jgi:hypothetical protein
MLEGNIHTEAPTSNHQQSAEKREKKRKKLHLAARASATPPTQAPKSKALIQNPVFRLQGDGF